MERPRKIYLSDFTDVTEPVFYVKKYKSKESDIEYIHSDLFVNHIMNYIKKTDTEYINVDEFIKIMMDYIK